MSGSDDAFDNAALLASVTEAARTAGEMALDFFRPGERTSAAVESKEGGSPVTEADRLVDRFLKERLTRLAPEAGWLSEETLDTPERLSRRCIFVVDPIDGTRAFMAGDRRWAVSIALVADGRPEFGIVHLPALAETFIAARDRGAWRNDVPIAVSSRPSLVGAHIAGPKSLLGDLERAGLAFVREPRIPSLAYRLVQVACGALDAGLASTDACDWDIAAADLIVREAGGLLSDLAGRAVIYNGPDPRHGVLLAAPRRLHGDFVAATRRAREVGNAKGWDERAETNFDSGRSIHE
jgi:myo-inositol-1(or 4)-monophosphatase